MNRSANKFFAAALALCAVAIVVTLGTQACSKSEVQADVAPAEAVADAPAAAPADVTPAAVDAPASVSPAADVSPTK